MSASARAAVLALPAPSGPPPAWTRRVTFLIKAFERPACAVRAVVTVKRHVPHAQVLVCDDSREPLFSDGERPAVGVSWFTLPFEAGHTLGAGRNALVARTQTPLFFLMDDDQFITAGTRIEAMIEALDAHGLDLVAGAQGRWDYGTAVFERRDREVLQHFHRHHGVLGPRLVRCDRTSNTFLARTEKVAAIGWEERVYANEHADFFLRAKEAGLAVAQLGGTHVGHDRRCEAGGWQAWLPHPDATYRALRWGGSRAVADEGYRKYVLDKHGVDAITDRYRLRDRLALWRVLGAP